MVSPAPAEVRRRFTLEFDYAREGRDMNDVRARMRRWVERKRVRIPEAYMDLTTERVLARGTSRNQLTRRWRGWLRLELFVFSFGGNRSLQRKGSTYLEL